MPRSRTDSLRRWIAQLVCEGNRIRPRRLERQRPIRSISIGQSIDCAFNDPRPTSKRGSPSTRLNAADHLSGSRPVLISQKLQNGFFGGHEVSACLRLRRNSTIAVSVPEVSTCALLIFQLLQKPSEQIECRGARQRPPCLQCSREERSLRTRHCRSWLPGTCGTKQRRGRNSRGGTSLIAIAASWILATSIARARDHPQPCLWQIAARNPCTFFAVS